MTPLIFAIDWAPYESEAMVDAHFTACIRWYPRGGGCTAGRLTCDSLVQSLGHCEPCLSVGDRLMIRESAVRWRSVERPRSSSG